MNLNLIFAVCVWILSVGIRVSLEVLGNLRRAMFIHLYSILNLELCIQNDEKCVNTKYVVWKMKNVFQSEEDLRNLNCPHLNDLKWTSHCSCTVKCKRGNVETSHAGKCADQSCDNLSWFKEELDVVKQDNELGHACFPFCGDGIKNLKLSHFLL